MKKICLIALGLCAAFAASAQADVVKEAERALKADKDAKEVITIITPALSDPTTSTQANTWFIPGKASYKQYDNLLGLRQLNKLPEGGIATMGQLLQDGYNYYIKALPLDKVPDKKGVIKTGKITKEICNTVVGHFNDYSDYGVELFQAGDYKSAYNLWDIFCAIPQQEEFRQTFGKNAPADTAISLIAYNKALAAWQMEDYPKAMAAFHQAKDLGYDKKNLYDYAIQMAKMLKSPEDLLAFAQEGRARYGNEENSYLAEIVNYYLTEKQYDEAFRIINEAITEEPDNAQYLVIRGVLYENTDDFGKALADYKTAAERDPSNVQAVYYYGRMLTAEADRLDNEAPALQAEYDVYYQNTVKPQYEAAAAVLEKAYELDNEGTYARDNLNILENIYYKIQDARYDDVQKRKELL